jgi:hypothetical protein
MTLDARIHPVEPDVPIGLPRPLSKPRVEPIALQPQSHLPEASP